MWLQVGRAVGLFQRRTESSDSIREENSLLRIGIVGLLAIASSAQWFGTPAKIKK